MNFYRFISKWVGTIANYVVGGVVYAYLFATGLVNKTSCSFKATYNQFKDYLKPLALITVNLVLITAGVLATRQPVLIWFYSMIVGLALFFTWKFLYGVIELITGIAKADITKNAGEAIEKLIKPLLKIALFCFFLASVISLRGDTDLTWATIGIWGGVGFFFIAFSHFWKKPTLIYEKLLCWLMALMLICHFIPDSASVIFLTEEKIMTLARPLWNSGTKSNLVIIPANVCLFQKNSDGSFKSFRKNLSETRARILATESANNTSLKLHKVLLETGNGTNSYLGGEELYVEVGTVKEIEDAPQQKNENSPVVDNSSTVKNDNSNVTKKLPRARIDGVSNRLVKKLGPGLYEITVYPDTTIATGIYIDDGTDYSVTSTTPCEVVASSGNDGHVVNGFQEFTKRGSTDFDLTGVPGYCRGTATLKFKEKTLRNVSGKK